MLDHFFRPNSIAVIGAAREEHKVGHSVLKNILQYGFQGRIYPINPKADSILGLKAYPSVKSVEDSVELAVLVLPSQLTLEVIDECAQKGIYSAVIISGGFKESGVDGAAREKELLSKIKRYGMRVIGPNCLGVINTHHCLNATFAASSPPKGDIAFFSQSGALCTAILDWAQRERIGFSKFVSMGNIVDISEVDLLEALEEDPETRVILGYIEGIKDGRAFMEVASRVTKKKAVVITKAGGSAAGARAASSHTGSLAGSDKAFSAAFLQAGVLRARTLEELFDLARAFSYQEVLRGPGVAIITNAGGPGIIASDAVEYAGLRMSSFTKETVDGLRGGLPPFANLYNPVDILGDAKSERYRYAMEGVIKDENVHAILVILTPQAMTDMDETARAVGEISARAKRKAVVASFMGGPLAERGAEVLSQYKVPNYPFPERAISVLSAMYRQRQWVERPVEEPKLFKGDKVAVREVFRQCLERGYSTLAEGEAREVISAYGFSVPRSILVNSKESAIKVAEEIGYPVVLKVASPDILHKSDIGGVRVGIRNSSDVVQAFEEILEKARRRMPDALVHGVFVQEMVRGGKEVILGATLDPQFGPLLMFGLGGIYVEVLKDVSFRVAPITQRDAREMLGEIRAYPLLKGARGESPVDLEAIVEGLQRLSQLVTDFPQVLELDINPLSVLPKGKGAVAIDARINISPG
ncbi:MAG: acetate--CoA ligase family protein [Candidatus Brocadiales bacterium]|nr:acetate--CoA ligase family protein [Candidatus Brocadiales bacterium]